MNKYAYRISVTANHYWLQNLADILEWLDEIYFEDYTVNGTQLSAYSDWVYDDSGEVMEWLQDIADFFRVEIECRIEDGNNDVTPVTLQPGESISSTKCAFWSAKLLDLNNELGKAQKQERSVRSTLNTTEKFLSECREMNQLLIRDNKRLMRG